MLSQFYTPAEITVHFYDSLHEKNFKAAWACLDEDIKNVRWGNDLNRFASGYEYTLAIDTINCEELEATDATATCKISYRDEKEVLCHPLLEGLDETSPKAETAICDFETFLIEELGADPEKATALPRTEFFKPNAVEVLTWLADADREKIRQHLTERKNYEEMTARKVGCVHTNQGWLINSIGPV